MIVLNQAEILKKCIDVAKGRKFKYLTPEILFQVLIEDQIVLDTLLDLDLALDVIDIELEEYLSDNDLNDILSEKEIKTLSVSQDKEDNDYTPIESDSFYEIVNKVNSKIKTNKADSNVKTNNQKQISLIFLKELIKTENDQESSFLSNLLLSSQKVQLQIPREKQMNDVLNNIEKKYDQIYAQYESQKRIKNIVNQNLRSGIVSRTCPALPSQKTKEEEYLSKFATNVNQKLEKENYTLVGREKELDKMIHILSRKNKNNPIVVGQPGVGKTSLIYGLAQKILDKEVPSEIEDFIIYDLNLSKVMAGTKYRGELEERLSNIIRITEKNKNIMLFVDEIHNLIGMGKSKDDSGDVANLIKPHLQDGSLRMIGCTTEDEYRRIFSTDEALDRRFHQVSVSEPTIKETIQILEGVKSQYENFHNLDISHNNLENIVKLSDQYISHRNFPDKALDILDDVSTLCKLNNKKVIEKEDIIKSVEKSTNIKINIKDLDFKKMQENLQSQIFGQDENIKDVVSNILISKSGLDKIQKPLNTFVFLGSTGVGKTALCQALKDELNMKLKIFDMSEYSTSQDAAKLIGAPNGYVGYKEGGLLTNYVSQHKNSIILLDEFEKAHEDISNTFLQVFDRGELTDSKGNKVDFTNSIIIMTSNLGVESTQKKSIGLSKVKTNSEEKSDYKSKLLVAMNQYYKPEFINRIDQVVCFNKLEQKDNINIVKKFIEELSKSLKEKDIEIKISKKALDHLSVIGFDEKMGARPVERLIRNKIKSKIAPELQFGELKNGGSVKIGFSKDELTFNFKGK